MHFFPVFGRTLIPECALFLGGSGRGNSSHRCCHRHRHPGKDRTYYFGTATVNASPATCASPSTLLPSTLELLLRMERAPSPPSLHTWHAITQQQVGSVAADMSEPVLCALLRLLQISWCFQVFPQALDRGRRLPVYVFPQRRARPPAPRSHARGQAAHGVSCQRRLARAAG